MHKNQPKRRRRARPGDLWQLGRHRLLCGDATSSDDVQRLIGRRRVRLCVTDPPYGVNYDPSWRVRDLGNASCKSGLVYNDHRVDWTDAYRLFPGDVVYAWHGGKYAGEVAGHLRDAGFLIRAQIIWRKKRFTISRGHYHWQHEPCWYAVRKGRTAGWSGDRKQRTVWDVVATGDDDARTIHAAQKPVDCMAWPIRNHGRAGDWIYDPFVGSGSAIIGAQRVGRRCLGMEISPEYCDLAIERFEGLTGRRARRLTYSDR